MPASACSIQTPDQIIEDAMRCLDGVCLTDHNSVAGAERALAISKATGFPVFIGVEASIASGHFLVFTAGPPPVDGAYDLERLAETLKDHEHVIIPAHVHRDGGGERTADLVREHRELFTAIEVYNNNCGDADTERNLALAHELGLPAVGCSDAHARGITGIHYTDFEDEIKTTLDLIRALKSGRYRPCRGGE
jgi:hypothetical protein